MERCIGCDAEAEQHPAVAVMNDQQELPEGYTPRYKDGGWMACPVCRKCMLSPERRKRNLKAHFFWGEQWLHGLASAGSMNLGG